MSALFLENGFAGFVNAARRKPRIAAVNGFALAGGFEIALACDLLVATERAQFGLPEVARGLIVAAGGAYRLGKRAFRSTLPWRLCSLLSSSDTIVDLTGSSRTQHKLDGTGIAVTL
jgi:hypothetical protein